MPYETDVNEQFENIFNAPPALCAFTPGRVNLLGEHTDYNGGMVLPTALGLGLSIAFQPREDTQIRLHSDQFDAPAIRDLNMTAQGDWSDYGSGAVIYAHKAGLIGGGADVFVKSTLPFGAGLSSSAALIVGILKLARDFAQSTLSDTEIAVLARRVENVYIGMPCGIMDQMAVAITCPGQALALDTRSLTYELIALPPNYHMAVVHSGHYRQLSDGRYKTRKEECDAVKAHLGREDICLIDDATLGDMAGLPDVLQRRGRHCVFEHRRTVQAAAALQAQDMARFGALMNASHKSMRDDFEITLPALDHLVEEAVACGALGARMTGGGFGGCIVACVPTAKLESWRSEFLSRSETGFHVY